MERNLIVLLRHGETNLSSQGIIQGQSNKAVLTKNGVSQIENACELLKMLKVDYLYSSPLARARETSDILLKNLTIDLNIDPVYDDRLMEIDFNRWTGLSKQNILDTDTDCFKLWKKSPFDLEFDGVFPVRDLYSGVNKFCMPFLDSTTSKGTSIISGHKGSILSLAVTLLGFDPSKHNFLHVDHGSLTVIRECSRNVDRINYELIAANLTDSTISFDSFTDI